MSSEQADRLLHPKNEIEYWVKPGMSSAIRSQDSIHCGGSSRGTDFTNQQMNVARQSDDKNDFVTRSRLTKTYIEWQDWFERGLDMDNLGNSVGMSEEEKELFKKQGYDLLERLKSELGSEYKVRWG